MGKAVTKSRASASGGESLYLIRRLPADLKRAMIRELEEVGAPSLSIYMVRVLRAAGKSRAQLYASDVLAGVGGAPVASPATKG